jgi:flavin-dependent dehydrogenase
MRADVLVVGAGVAGAVSAGVLAERYSVTIIDQATSPLECAGEYLPGAARVLLHQLGLLREFEADRHEPSLGAASIWGSRQLTRRDCFVDPYGPGWRIDRARFDSMCRKSAVERGANLIAPARLIGLSGDSVNTHRWAVRIDVEGVEQTLHVRFLIDATGRRTMLSHRLGASSITVGDRLVGRLTHVKRCPAITSIDHFSLVEAVADGWWYLASLPDGNRIAGFFTDSDLPAAHATRDRLGFANLLIKSQQIAQLVTPEDLMGPIVCVSARSQRSSKLCGDDWCAIGDAALALDPLSSQGISNALYTGYLGAETVASRLTGELSAFDRYTRCVDAIWNTYRDNLASCYRMEKRFLHEAFWQRRS